MAGTCSILGVNMSKLAQSYDTAHTRSWHFMVFFTQKFRFLPILIYRQRGCIKDRIKEAEGHLMDCCLQAPYNLRFVFQTEILEATSKAAELIRCLSKEIHEMKQTFKCSQCQRIPCDSLKQMQPVSRRKYSWPSQEVDAFEDGADGIGRIRAWENTAALSLVTFTSLLIEFVARLVIIWL